MSDSVGLVDKVMALKAVEALRAVPTEQLSHVAQVARGRVYAGSETLFREGDPPGPLYILTRGRVALRRGTVTTAELGAGSPLGTWSLFDDQPRTNDAVALEETEVLVVDREDFYEAIAEHPEIARSLMTDMVRRLRRTLLD